jgi:hypothetical protein
VIDKSRVRLLWSLEGRYERIAESLNDGILEALSGIGDQITAPRQAFGVVDFIERSARKIEVQIMEGTDAINHRACAQIVDRDASRRQRRRLGRFAIDPKIMRRQNFSCNVTNSASWRGMGAVRP